MALRRQLGLGRAALRRRVAAAAGTNRTSVPLELAWIDYAGGANNKVYANAIFFFKLPILQSGETLTSANLRVIELADPTNGPPTINADLWALGYDNHTIPTNGPAESQAYYYNGPLDPNPGVGTGAMRTLIQDNFLIPWALCADSWPPVARIGAECTPSS